jgi:lysozyme
MAEPAPQTKQQPRQKKTLIGVLGLSAALLLMQAVPREESSRVVVATPTADGHINLRNVAGRMYLKAYLDSIGVATACDGLTYDQQGKKVKLGERFTEEQCSTMLEASLVDSASHVMSCAPGLEGHDGPKVASALLAHNIGWPTFCRSSMKRLFNQHAYSAACARFPLYDMAGGRHLPALKKRRIREQYICNTGRLPYA